MSITSLTFLFLFLPLALGIYYIAPRKCREYVLLAVSLLFYAIGSLRYIALFAAAAAVTVLLGRLMERSASRMTKRVILTAGIVMNAGLLGYYKYTDFVIASLNKAAGTDIPLRNLMLPLGISFFTFKAISYLADIYTGKAKLDKNPVHDLLYLSFFAQIQSGPLARYGEMQTAGPLFTEGVFRFLIGFNKKVLLADVLSHITTEVYAAPFDNFTAAYAWFGALCYSLQLYFDFSGYSDMAIGISAMFGYRCRENFNYPYMTESVSKFWRRWHISLSEWFRDYIYFPLGGSRSKSRVRVVLNLFVVWLLTGIWHGAAWNFVFWGLGYFVLIAFEHLTGYPKRFRSRAAKIIYRVLTLLFINFQWVLFRAPGMKNGVKFIRCMLLGGSGRLGNVRTAMLFREYFVFILFAIILCFPVVPQLRKKWAGRGNVTVVCETLLAVVILGLFIWGISFVISGQNNPFAYANF